MAHVRFDLTKALNREAYAYNCWVNKNYENNTLAITDDEIRQIEERWGNERVRDWKFEVENDHTEYEISDDDFDLATLESKEAAKVEVEGKTGENSAKVQKGRNAANIAGGALSLAGAATGTGFAIAGGIGGAIAGAVAFIITCPISLAVGVLYQATKPNKKPHDALMELKTLMESSTTTLKQNQAEMETLGNNVSELATSAEEEQKQKQEEINTKAQILMYATIIQNDIRNKVNAGEPITSSEKSMYEDSSKQISALATEVDQMTASLISNSMTKASEISLVTGEFDQKALNIAAALGQADFAASFDEATKNLAVAQIAMQSANAVSGTAGAVAALVAGGSPFTFWTLAFAAMGFTGAGLSIAGVVEQSKFVKDIKEEIGVRENLQSMVGKSLESYSLNISKQVVAQQVAESTNTLENTERFGEALTTSESINVQVTPENPESGNNPFGFNISEGEEDANPFNKKPVI